MGRAQLLFYQAQRSGEEGPGSREAKGKGTSPQAVFPASCQHTGARGRGEDLSWVLVQGTLSDGGPAPDTLDFITRSSVGTAVRPSIHRGTGRMLDFSGSSCRKEESRTSSQCSGSTAGFKENAWKSRWGPTPAASSPGALRTHLPTLPAAAPRPSPAHTPRPALSSSSIDGDELGPRTTLGPFLLNWLSEANGKLSFCWCCRQEKAPLAAPVGQAGSGASSRNRQALG